PQCLQWVYDWKLQNHQCLQPSLRVYGSNRGYTYAGWNQRLVRPGGQPAHPLFTPQARSHHGVEQNGTISFQNRIHPQSTGTINQTGTSALTGTDGSPDAKSPISTRVLTA